MDGEQTALMAERLQRAMDIISARLDRIEAEAAHRAELDELRLAALERSRDDQETRLRAVSDGVTQFKVWSGLASGGSTILAAVAFLREVLGIK
jgi:hypothetical protein